MGPRTAAFQEERVQLFIVGDEPDRPLARPHAQGVCLVFTLPMRKLDLEHHLGAVRPPGRQNEGHVRLEWPVDLEVPPLHAVLDELRKSLQPGTSLQGVAQPQEAFGYQGSGTSLTIRSMAS